MMNWLLTVMVSFAVNGQSGWVAVEPEVVIYASKEACVAAGKKWKGDPAMRANSRVYCTMQFTGNNMVIMPPLHQAERMEVK